MLIDYRFRSRWHFYTMMTRRTFVKFDLIADRLGINTNVNYFRIGFRLQARALEEVVECQNVFVRTSAMRKTLF